MLKNVCLALATFFGWGLAARAGESTPPVLAEVVFRWPAPEIILGVTQVTLLLIIVVVLIWIHNDLKKDGS